MREIIFAVSTLLLSANLFAQSTNNQSILGTVQDASGASVPNATVTVVNTDTNLSRSATSNDNGNYVVANLPIGIYNVSATAPGFKKVELQKVEVTVSQQATINLKLLSLA